MKELKWTLDNFNFYYEGDLSSNFSDFNSEIYNQKFKDLLDNDEILCYNYNILKNKWEWLAKNRITFQYFIDKELEIIYNEIKKAVDLFDFFNWYLQNTGKCYINVVDDYLLEFANSEDTIIFVQDLNGTIIGVLQPDGTLAPYDPDIYGTPATNPNSIVITSTSTTGSIQEATFCGEEVVLEGTEYDFC
jgi:hypothetical protein